MAGQDQVGVQHRKQLTRRAGRLPAQRHCDGGTTADRFGEAHTHQLGQPPHPAERADPQHDRQPALVGTFADIPQGITVQQIHQPRDGRLERRRKGDLVSGEHKPTVLAPGTLRSGTKVPHRAAEVWTFHPAAGFTARPGHEAVTWKAGELRVMRLWKAFSETALIGFTGHGRPEPGTARALAYDTRHRRTTQ